MRPQPVATASAKFDLSLGLVEQRSADGAPAGIEGVLEYASDLFDAASVERLGQRLIRLLAAVAGAPDRALGDIDILEPAERDTILRVWNDTAHCIAIPRAFHGAWPGRRACGCGRDLACAVCGAGVAHAGCRRGDVR